MPDNGFVRALVIRGTGFLGPEVVHQLIDAGSDVAIFHRGVREAALPPSVRHLHGDRRELAAFGPAFRSFDPEVVIDMRPMTEEHAQQLVSTSPDSRSAPWWSAAPTCIALTGG